VGTQAASTQLSGSNVRYQNHPSLEWMKWATKERLILGVPVTHHGFPMGKHRFHVNDSPDWNLDTDERLFDVGADGNCGFR
jgi:hypothetical protein